jgi:hypothetical protein
MRSGRKCSLLSGVHIYDWPKRAGKRGKDEIALGKLVISSGDAAKMLDAIEKPFDEVACTVQRTVVASLCLAIRTRGNHDLRPGSPNPLHEVVSIVALICDHRSGAQMLDQLRGARDIGDLSFSYDQPQRATFRIHRQMQFGAQSPSRTSERLRPAFFKAPAECWCEITSSLVYGQLMAGDVKRRVSADPVDRLAPVRHR